MNLLRTLGSAVLLTAIVGGCGEDDKLAGVDPYKPYQDNSVTVIGGATEKPVATGVVTEQNCLQVTDATCVPVERTGAYCKETTGPTDVVLVDGVVKQVVCYSDSDSTNGPSTIIDSNSDGNLDVPQQANGAVITFDPSSDGKPINGNISIDGNNVTLYGNGPDKSIIDGNLEIKGNNARVRGVRVKGNVLINLNTAAILLSVIEGNLIIEANNALAAENDVFGEVKVTGNNTILVGNQVKGNWSIGGSGQQCDDNYAFTDSNEDKIVQDTERGAALTCPR